MVTTALMSLWLSTLRHIFMNSASDSDNDLGFLLLQKSIQSTLWLVVVTAATLLLTLIAMYVDGAVTRSAQIPSFVGAICICVILGVILRVSPSWKRPHLHSLMYVIIVFITASYAACSSILLWHAPCSGDGDCVIPEVGNAEVATRNIIWGAFILSIYDISTITARLTAKYAAIRMGFLVLVDIIWISLQSFYFDVASDVLVLVFISLFSIHCMHVLACIRGEIAERVQASITRAVESAVSDRQELLHDLFPPAVVTALLAGVAVPTVVSEGAVVLYCDLEGFTRMCSTMEPLQIMRSMNEVYSVFDQLVEDASLDGALWKVETVGDAYIVVAGLNRLENDGTAKTMQRHSSRTHSRSMSRSRLRAALLSPDEQQLQADRRTRILLERMFALAHVMQEALEDLRSELGISLRARIGVHCGQVVSGIIGSQRPRFCVLGAAMLAAEHTEAAGTPGEVVCTPEAQHAYLSSTFRFETQVPSVASNILLVKRPLAAAVKVKCADTVAAVLSRTRKSIMDI